MSQDLIKYAKYYLKNGFSVLRHDGKKMPVGSWKRFQTEMLGTKEVTEYFSHPAAQGLGIITGAVSGNLEVIDVDTKHSLNPNLFEDLMQAIMDMDETLPARFLIATTPSGGYHIYYRCPEAKIDGNRKLAQREATADELKANPNEKRLCFVETRGESGYVAAVPSAGYKVIQGKYTEIPELTPAQRDTILTAAFSLNEYVPQAHYHEVGATSKSWGKSPLDDYNERGDIIGLLQKHGWKVVRERGEKVIMLRPGNTDSKSSGDFHRGKNLFSVFTTSSQFEPMKGYKPAAVYAFLEHNGDFKAAARALLDEGFGTRKKAIDRQVEETIRTAKERGQEGAELVSILAISAKITEEEAAKMVADYEANAGDDIRTFWSINSKTLKPTIMQVKLEQFLAAGGFGLFFYGDSRTIFKVVRNDNGIVEEVSTENIKKYVKDYVESLPGNFDDITRDDLLEVVYRTKVFSDGFYEFLPRLDLNFLKDNKDWAHYPFQNGVVRVGKGGAEMKTYGELGKCVWRSQIIQHSIEIAGDDLDPASIEFYRFISSVCNNDPERIQYMMQTAGYLLHGHKDPASSFCVVLTEETDDESKGGGTGKGIFFKALGKLVPQLVMDGKNFKLDKSFAFQRVQLDHKLVVIDDIRARVDFEGFYSMITEGFTIEKKNKDELYIPYADAPKIIFSTNYAIPAGADHARRRQRILEFFKFYHPGFTPKDHFGHNLFDDWEESEWSKFFNFLFACVQSYLISGLPVRETSEASKKKQVKIQFGDEFYDWFEGYLGNGCETEKLFNDLRANFLSNYDLEAKDYSSKRFKKGLETAVSVFGFELLSRKGRAEGNKVFVKVQKNTPSAPESGAIHPIENKSGEEQPF